MTTDEITAVREQAYEMIDNAGFGVSEKTITTTSEPIENFTAVWGDGKTDRDIALPHRVWRDIQKNGPRTARGTLIVIDFGSVRVASFC